MFEIVVVQPTRLPTTSLDAFINGQLLFQRLAKWKGLCQQGPPCSRAFIKGKYNEKLGSSKRCGAFLSSNATHTRVDPKPSFENLAEATCRCVASSSLALDPLGKDTWETGLGPCSHSSREWNCRQKLHGLVARYAWSTFWYL